MQLPVLDTRPVASAHFDTGPRSIAAVKLLRISLTDRCNFRCLYCMPEDGVAWLPREELLTDGEIAEIVAAAVAIHGIGRFKLTGGEPTLRPELPELVRRLRAIPGVQELSLTTNGMLLEKLAPALARAGLDRVTVSIDSLHPQRFRQITRTGDLATVLRGLEAAQAAGMRGLKVNCVAMRGVNDDEFPAFARLTIDRPVTVRFIEYMPLGDAALLHTGAERGPAAGCGAQDRGPRALITEAEIRARIESALGGLSPVPREREPGVGPANVYRLPEAVGRIGFISAMSAPFCDTCNRLRLTADGQLRSCLFEGGTVNLRPLLRDGRHSATERPRALAHAMAECVRLKPQRHSQHGADQMSRIGG